MQNLKGAISHLNDHQTYPATKEELVKECNELSDFSESDKEWFEKNLPKRTYTSSMDVMQALGWDNQASQASSI